MCPLFLGIAFPLVCLLAPHDRPDPQIVSTGDMAKRELAEMKTIAEEEDSAKSEMHVFCLAEKTSVFPPVTVLCL